MISISVGTTVLVVIIVVLLVRCYLNWKRQHWKQKKKTGTVRQLVIPSRTVDFFLLPIQDQLVEEEGEDENGNNFYISGGRSTEDLNQSRDGADSKVRENPVLVALVAPRFGQTGQNIQMKWFHQPIRLEVWKIQSSPCKRGKIRWIRARSV